jgi:hypothetical protein
MVQPRLLPWPPVPQVPHLTHAALISAALVPWLDFIMPAWAFQSSKLGLMPSKPATATPSMVSSTPMQPGTVRTLTRQSWAILPKQHQNVLLAKPKPTLLAPLAVLPPPVATPSNQVFVLTKLLSKLFINNTGHFSIRACSRNQYIMIAFHANSNLILQQAFKSKSDRHRIAAYNTIMTPLAAQGLSVNFQILDNKASSAYKEAITFKWNATFQLVPPDIHCRN